MKIRYLTASVALAAMVPATAMAQDRSCEQHRSGRVAATIGGAAAGGALGSVIAGRGDKREAAVVGAIIGGIAGNQLAKSNQNCRAAYGYYDKQGRWHATGVSSSQARGYFDRNGDWVDGAPNGYYDGDRWVMGQGDYNDNGYTDRDGHWVPASSSGYYDRNGRWMAGTSNGYYDTRGRWVAGATTGRYDDRGRWIAGNPGYSESNGNWSSQEQPGYYDNGRWRAGRVYGYYDARGRWVNVRGSGSVGNGNGNDYDDDRNDDYDMDEMPTDTATRISWLREYVRSAESARRIDRMEANYARSELNAINNQFQLFERNGRMTARQERNIGNRLDRLTRRLDRDWRQARSN